MRHSLRTRRAVRRGRARVIAEHVPAGKEPRDHDHRAQVHARLARLASSSRSQCTRSSQRATSSPVRRRTSSSTRRRQRTLFGRPSATCGCTMARAARSSSSRRQSSAFETWTFDGLRSARTPPRRCGHECPAPGSPHFATARTSSSSIATTMVEALSSRTCRCSSPLRHPSRSRCRGRSPITALFGVRSCAARPLTAVLVAVASGFVTSLLGLVLVGRPLAELVSQARRVGEGDLTYRISTRRRDEVAVLAREMNRMCDRLRDSRENERAQADAKNVRSPSCATRIVLRPWDGSRRGWRTSSGRRSMSCWRARSR